MNTSLFLYTHPLSPFPPLPTRTWRKSEECSWRVPSVCGLRSSPRLARLPDPPFVLLAQFIEAQPKLETQVPSSASLEFGVVWCTQEPPHVMTEKKNCKTSVVFTFQMQNVSKCVWMLWFKYIIYYFISKNICLRFIFFPDGVAAVILPWRSALSSSVS